MIKPLIYNSDIRELKNKMITKGCLSPDELGALRHEALSESQIQQAFKRIFEARYGDGFAQIDNGGKMSIAMKMKKKREGTKPGMVDLMLIGNYPKLAFVEVKKVGSPAEIDPSEEQKKVHESLRKKGWPVYVTNNTMFFEKVICEEFSGK